MRTCVIYCRVGNTEFLPGTQYRVDYNPFDRCLRIYTVWGAVIVSPEFLNRHFV